MPALSGAGLQRHGLSTYSTNEGDEAMENYDDEHEPGDQNVQMALGFLAGILIGGLAGAGTMLLLAPQSGKRTRAQIQHKGVELRDQATESIEDAMDQARATGRHISAGVHKQADKIQQKAEKIQQRGQDMLDDQKERWSPVVEAGQKAVQGT
jgi:gas vesicle protein